MAKNHHTVGFSLPQNQIRELERLAVEYKRPKSFFVQQALEEFFRKERAALPNAVLTREPAVVS